MRKKRIISTLLLGCFMATSLLTHAAAAEATRFEVETSEQFIAAVEQINTADSGNFEIILQKDIQLSQSDNPNQTVVFKKNTATIYGNDYTLDLNESALDIRETAVVNLGSADYDKGLLLLSNTTYHTTIYVNDNSVLNMYDHVTIKDGEAMGHSGALQVEENSVFNMYGGLISNCSSHSAAGGVLVSNTATFTMYDGKIENCFGYYGGGVGILGSGNFIMNGGEISGSTGKTYGGGGVMIFAPGGSLTINNGLIDSNQAQPGPAWGMEGEDGGYGGGISVFAGTVQITGGTISNNHSLEWGGGIAVSDSSGNVTIGSNCEIKNNSTNTYGGGVCVYEGSLSIAENTKIHNNHAKQVGDDIFNYTGSLRFFDVAQGLILDGCQHPIDGWYVDGVIENVDTARWNAIETDDTPAFLRQYTPTGSSITSQIALKAAHTAYQYTVHYYIDNVQQDAFTENGISPVPSLQEVPDKRPENCCEEDTVTIDSVVEPADDKPGSFIVRVYYQTHQYELASNETKHWSVCTLCDHIINETDHTYGDWNVIQEASELVDGSRERTCSVCKYKETDILKAPGHDWADAWSSDANAHWHDCGNDNCEVSDNTDKDGYAPHSFGDWVVTKPATATEDGSRKKSCIVCGYTETEVLKALGTTTTPQGKPTESAPPTGNSAMHTWWITLLAAGGCIIAGASLYSKRGKQNH